MTANLTTAQGARLRRWPLFLIAAPAAVAIWSGWIGLGSLCGFGLVHPLPGIWGTLRLNTSVTLPVGVEAYGATALGAWLSPRGVPAAARTFAKRSAIGALLLGMLGQVAYHLLAAAHAARAPWPVVVLVSCMPVVTLGFATALTHKLHAGPEHGTGEHPAGSATEGAPVPAPETARRSAPVPLLRAPRERSRRAPAKRSRARAAVTVEAAENEFMAELAAGALPSLRQIRARLHVGPDRAKLLLAHMENVTASTT
jgi:hypothetical protein